MGNSRGAGGPKQRDLALATSTLRDGCVTPEQSAIVYGLDTSAIGRTLSLESSTGA